MSRLLFAAALFASVALPVAAQDKKDPPKMVERIAIADPEKVKDDPDFAIQGEYVGEVPSGTGGQKKGAQVVAKGDGRFDVKILNGGLPGAGWDGKAAVKMTAERRDNKVLLFVDKNSEIGSIANGVMTLSLPAMTMKKIIRKSRAIACPAPAGAVVLFGKAGDEKNWDGGKLTELSDGKFLNIGIKSKQKFQAFQAHVEFRLPWMPNSSGQGRGNSGVYLQDRYELQVLDSFGLNGENNECGGIYTLHKPSVNMCYPPLSWQTYDIFFTPAVFEGEKKVKNARTTILHNGVKIHDDVELKGPTGGGQPENAMPGPLQLQNHGDPVVYNNVWVVEMK